MTSRPGMRRIPPENFSGDCRPPEPIRPYAAQLSQTDLLTPRRLTRGPFASVREYQAIGARVAVAGFKLAVLPNAMVR